MEVHFPVYIDCSDFVSEWGTKVACKSWYPRETEWGITKTKWWAVKFSHIVWEQSQSLSKSNDRRRIFATSSQPGITVW